MRRVRRWGVRRALLALAALGLLAGPWLTVGPGLTGAVLSDTAGPANSTFGTIGTYDQRVKALNPVGYWRLNEPDSANGSTAIDSSGNGHNGTWVDGVLKWSSQNTAYTSGNGYQYYTLGVNATYTIQAGDRFEYDILSAPGAPNQGVDFTATDGTTFRGNYTDQNGNSSHPASYSPSSVNWEHRVFTMASGTIMVGKTIARVDLVNEADSSGTMGAWIGPIRITDAAGNIKKSFWAAGDPVPTISPKLTAPSVGSAALIAGGLMPQNQASPLVIYGGSPAVTHLRGEEDGVQVPYNAAFDMASSTGFTVEAWVNSSQLTTSAFVSFASADHFEQYNLDFYSGTARFFVRKPDGTGVVVQGPSVNDGTWHDVVGVFSNGSVSLYVDGVLAQTATGATGGLLAEPAGTLLRIGGRPSRVTQNMPPYGVRGSLAEVALYPVALTPAQIADHYNLR